MLSKGHPVLGPWPHLVTISLSQWGEGRHRPQWAAAPREPSSWAQISSSRERLASPTPCLGSGSPEFS